LAQALGNLLANAVEHGGGDVTVRGRTAGDAIRVEVADRGQGLTGQRQSTGGRGRGLAIAKRSLEQAGGRLDSRPRAGGGRVAIAELPLERAR
jgi:two-component system sensor histidine kinase MtrB